jgi:hypothetical protein
MPASSKPHTLEFDLYPTLFNYFDHRDYLIEIEVPIYKNRIDMVAMNSNETIAVELKLKNWHRALRQATYYQLGADYTYIAMPFYQATELYKRKYHLEKDGIGLFAILVDKNEVRELVKPERSQRKINYIEDGIKKLIMDRRADEFE